MKVATSIFAAAGFLCLGACATDETIAPAPTTGATQMDPEIINPTEPSRDPLGTPPIAPEVAQ